MTEVEHTNYKLNTFKGGFRINITLMLMCCHLVQNQIDCFQLEDVYELPKTNDSKAGLVDNLNEFVVEQDARRKQAKKHKKKRVLNLTMPDLHPKAKKKKKNSPHGQLLWFIPK